jgi:hypothetical protein
MVIRIILLLTAAVLLGTAITAAEDGSSLGFWLAAASGFTGCWSLCPFSRPLLPRHKRLKRQ